MYWCRICQWLVELDDAICPTLSGWCICRSCQARILGEELMMPKPLREKIEAVLNAYTS
jgi:hypothetical protein